MNEFNTTESNLRVSQLSEEIEGIISDKIDGKLPSAIHEAVSREEERRYRQIKWFIAFVGVVGLGTFGTMANYLIEKAVDSRMEAKAGNLSESLDFMRFYTLTLKLDLGTSYSNEDRDAILTYLRTASKIDRVRHSKEFMAGLIQVAESFASSGQSSALDEIFSLYEREVLTSPTLVEAFLHHYGQDIVERNSIPANDSSMVTFEKLERAAGNNSEELALYYRILYTYKTSNDKKSAAINDLIGRVPNLNERDLSRLLAELFQRTRATNWQKKTTPGGIVFQTLIRRFLSDHANTLASKLQIPNDFIIEASKNGIPEDKVEPLAAAIANRLKK